MARSRRARRPAPAFAQQAAPAPPGDSGKASNRWLLGATLSALAVLALLVDDRHVGAIADGRQMIRTAVALAATGQIGQAAGFDFTLPRPQGDAVSRFGMGFSLAQVPAAWLAPRIERSLGPGSSQSLFLLAPWLCVGLAGYLAGRLAQLLGAPPSQTAVAVVVSALASPLGAYAQLEFSEPLQAVLLAGALTASLSEALAGGSSLRSVGAGLAVGSAVLTKSSLVVVAPWLLLPLWARADLAKTRSRLGLALLGASVPLSLWIYWELERFGRLFGGYADDRFTHPLVDGVWRLLFGWNRGLLWFFPALALALWALARTLSAQERQPTVRGAAAWGTVLAALGLLLPAATYWGWHGLEGWGPRLLVAAVPLLSAWAVLASEQRRSGPWILAAVFGLGLLSNLPPWWIHPTPVASYLMNLAWPEVPVEEAARLPRYARRPGSQPGRERVVPFEVLEREAAANPWRTYRWLGRLARLSDPALTQGLLFPPWRERLPGLVPESPWPEGVARLLVPRPRPGFLGRSLTRSNGPYGRVYLEALTDQVARASALGELELAWKLQRIREGISLDPEAVVWHLELLRQGGRWAELEQYLDSRPPEQLGEPALVLVLALAERDRGRETRARELLQSVAPALAGTRAAQALGQPIERWPRSVATWLQVPRQDALAEESRNPWAAD